MLKIRRICCLFALVFLAALAFGQTIKGTVTDGVTGESMIGATVQIKGTSSGTVTDFDGQFELRAASFPATLVISYSGFETQEIAVSAANAGKMNIKMSEANLSLGTVEVVASRISEEQKKTPLTVEALDAVAVKETAQASVYNALGNLKGVDLTTASLGFTIINTRGFNSTSPVRSLQMIDGVDNQAPGLNFSLGNFLGSSDLDIQGVDLIVGASSAFYGPNAFNGVISMTTKNPFTQRGLGVSVKAGERNLLEGAIRWADAWKNKAGQDAVAFKMNLFHLRADDWEADNYDAVTGTRTETGNPGGWDKVNVYGDEFFAGNDYSGVPEHDYPGLGIWHRTGYKEVDLVDYNTRNYKASASLHFRTRPARGLESPELIFCSGFGSGTTVYQGDNRFSLRDILFFQNRIELRKKDKWFIRAYATRDDAGRSFDPYFTALKMQNMAKTDRDWAQDYSKNWVVGTTANGGKSYRAQAAELGFPQPILVSTNPFVYSFDSSAAIKWKIDNYEILQGWHTAAATFANKANSNFAGSIDFLEPGTARFQHVFDSLTSTLSSAGGTRLYDKSSLYHLTGERKFEWGWFDQITIGAHTRMYTPDSRGTIFTDTILQLSSLETGAYLGAEKEFMNKRLRVSATIRGDKNFEDLFKNINGLDRKKASFLVATPAASIVFKPKANNYLRASFSSALRNPTLTDKYLRFNVGRAILSGNLQGVQNLLTVESFLNSINGATFNPSLFDSFNISPVRPEKVKTFELGYRTTLFNKIYVDAGYYFSFYNDFLGYNIGLTVDVDTSFFGYSFKDVKAYRYAANSINSVTTQGFSIGANYYFGRHYAVSGNYSWNRLNSNIDDPIIPAFNTPEHKFNIGVSGRDIPFKVGPAGKFLGWNVTYKWIDAFQFEGSPQFTGFIPSYDMVDAQVNCRFSKQHSTIKLGGSNILDKQRYQAYGGPRIGRMIYASLVYDFFEKD